MSTRLFTAKRWRCAKPKSGRRYRCLEVDVGMDRNDLKDDNEGKGTKPATKVEFGTEDVGKYLCFIRDGVR